MTFENPICIGEPFQTLERVQKQRGTATTPYKLNSLDGDPCRAKKSLFCASLPHCLSKSSGYIVGLRGPYVFFNTIGKRLRTPMYSGMRADNHKMRWGEYPN
jgi:hypothetical protein